LGFRSSLGVAGELFCMLLAVVLVAVIGGVRPAVLTTVSGFLLADFLYTHPYSSLRVDQLVDVVALVVFAVVAVVIGVLVDILTRQGVQVARARSQAMGLARLLARGLASDTEALSATSTELRRIFDLDSVALLRATDGGWESKARSAHLSHCVPRKPSSPSNSPTGGCSR
jgi:two-component system, OmpR family, sensor histidine kinase KdpD